MSEQEKFIIDTNCFIVPYKNYYDFVFESSYWNKLTKHIKAGNIIFIKSVKDEILNGDDELANWVKKLNIKPISENNNTEIINNYALIINYLNDRNGFNSFVNSSDKEERV